MSEVSKQKVKVKEPGKEFGAFAPPALNVPTDPWDVNPDPEQWRSKDTTDSIRASLPQNSAHSNKNKSGVVFTAETISAENISAENISAENISAEIITEETISAEKTSAEIISASEEEEYDFTEEFDFKPAKKKKAKAVDKLTEAKLRVKFVCKKRKETLTAIRHYLRADNFIFDHLIPAIGNPGAGLTYLLLFRKTWGQEDNKTKSVRISHSKLGAQIGLTGRTMQEVISVLNELGLVASKSTKERDILEHFVLVPWLRPGEKYPERAEIISAEKISPEKTSGHYGNNFRSTAEIISDDQRYPSSKKLNHRNLSAESPDEYPIKFVWRWEEMTRLKINSKAIKSEREIFKILNGREGEPFFKHAWGVFEDMLLNGDFYGRECTRPLALLNSDQDNWLKFFGRYKETMIKQGYEIEKQDPYANKTEDEIRAEIRAACEKQFGSTNA